MDRMFIKQLPMNERALTAREHDIARASCRGLTIDEVAAELVISNSTVNFHLRNIRQKLDARSTTHAVALYVARFGLAEVRFENSKEALMAPSS